MADLETVHATIDHTGITGAGGGGVTFSTLGTTSAGASFATGRGTYVKKITVASGPKLITSIAVFVKGTGSAYVGVTAVLFDDNGGSPGKIIAIAGPTTTNDAAAHTSAIAILSSTTRAISFPINYVAANGDYWIGMWQQNSAGTSLSLAFNSGTGSDQTQLLGGDAVKDASVASFSGTSDDFCIYANLLK